jgi:hypothetical protein
MNVLLLDVWSNHGEISMIGKNRVICFNPRAFLNQNLFKTYFTAEKIVNLHKSNNPYYMKMLNELMIVISINKIDILLAHQSFLPPEWLIDNLSGIIRVLGCFDDPQKTYSSTLPVAWAYHGLYYNSPSYSKNKRYDHLLKSFGVKYTHWFPLSTTPPSKSLISAVNKSWSTRENRMVYVGMCYGNKIDYLSSINREIDNKLEIYGKSWPLFGLAGFLAPIRGRSLLPKWVRPISENNKRNLYLSSLIGLNLHLGDYEEVGNMRTYEVPMHGLMLLSNTGGCNAHVDIYAPDVEAVFYSSMDEAIDKSKFYLQHPEKAVRIAQRGFEKAISCYSQGKVLNDLIIWASAISI